MTLCVAVCFLLILLVPCAGAGLALVNAGLGRTRNAAHAMLSALTVMALAALVFFTVGFAWQGYPGRAAWVLEVGGKPWNWIGAERFLLRGLEFDGSPATLAALFGMLAAGLAALIPLASGADRWRLGPSLASAALTAGLIYPLFAHWTWGGGWLASLGQTCSLGRGLLDSGGAASIQSVGGLTALAIAWILGPRRGKYGTGGMPAAIPAHNAVFVLLGCLVAWVGWLGLDGAGAILFTGVEMRALPLVAINATLGAAAAALTAAAITRGRFGKTDASLCANGWVAGLVASSAGCAAMRPAGAVLTGALAGALVVFAVEWLELHLGIDDPGGAVSVHALGGIWGLLAAGLFAVTPGASGTGQWMAQLAGVSTLVGFVLPAAFGLNALLNRFYRYRAAPEAERQGLDLAELGTAAYPDLASHNDDLWPR